MFDAFEHVLSRSHLTRNFHTVFLFDGLEPFQRWNAVAFESARMGAGLPYTGPEHIYSNLFETRGRSEALVQGFGAARSCNHARTRKGEKAPFHWRYDIKFHSIRYL